jgi:2-oxoglutarate dehydrogenase E2 component (dihydrolipoamide succinyltransferase)
MEIRIPEVGESVFEATVAKWRKADGQMVHKDELLCELETDKISLELHAEVDGLLSIRVGEGETVKIGSVIGVIEGEGKPAAEEQEPAPAKPERRGREKKGAAAPVEETPKEAEGPARGTPAQPISARPAARPESSAPRGQPLPPGREQGERQTREPMTPIRRRIAERLLQARQQTAMLTTFQEADLSRITALRGKHQETFRKRHGVGLGFMSFFVKAAVEALKEFPEVNARIDGGDIVYQHYYDIGIAVGSERGLVVPVLRDADRLHFADIEQGIADFVSRINDNRLTLADLEGGTFTITNGGVYGSLLSTPILNPPQSAVLGMHAIQERPVVRDGAVVVRPMMYLALSYDHRLIDGRQAVSFLRRIKDYVEEPEEMLLEH